MHSLGFLLLWLFLCNYKEETILSNWKGKWMGFTLCFFLDLLNMNIILLSASVLLALAIHYWLHLVAVFFTTFLHVEIVSSPYSDEYSLWVMWLGHFGCVTEVTSTYNEDSKFWSWNCQSFVNWGIPKIPGKYLSKDFSGKRIWSLV